MNAVRGRVRGGHVEIEASHPYVVEDIENGLGRSLCVTSPGEPIAVTVRFAVTRYETRGGGKASQAELAACLEPDRMIPLDGKVAHIAAAMPLEGDATAVGRALYEHTLERMKYDKPASGGWGRGESGDKAKAFALYKRAGLFGSRSADLIRASGHMCRANRPDT